MPEKKNISSKVSTNHTMVFQSIMGVKIAPKWKPPNPLKGAYEDPEISKVFYYGKLVKPPSGGVALKILSLFVRLRRRPFQKHY